MGILEGSVKKSGVCCSSVIVLIATEWLKNGVISVQTIAIWGFDNLRRKLTENVTAYSMQLHDLCFQE